jgi:benzoylformate decarboxylase
VLRVLRRAVKIAMTPPRGPVFVELPMDILDAPNTELVVPSTIPSRAVVPVAAELDRAAAALSDARKPVILMGDGISVAHAQAELAEIAAVLAADVYGVDSSELNLDTTDPRYRGTTGHMFGEQSAKAVAEADVVLIVGTYVFPDVFPALDNPFRPGTTVVHIDLDDYEVAKNYPVDVALIADPKPTLAALVDRLAGGRAVNRQPDPRAAARPTLQPDSPMIEHFAAELAAQTAGEPLVIFDEALTASPGLLRHLPPRMPGSYFATRGGSLGVGIPGAIGAKLARPHETVVGFTGDGGSMYTIQGLWTAARYGIGAKFVICDNHRYELLDHNIDQYWRERGIPAHDYPREFDLSHPEIGFAELAGSLSVDAVRVEKAAEVESAVRRMLAHDGPFLVDLVTA